MPIVLKEVGAHRCGLWPPLFHPGGGRRWGRALSACVTTYRPALLVQPLLMPAAAGAQTWGPCTNPSFPSSSCCCHGFCCAWYFRLDRHYSSEDVVGSWMGKHTTAKKNKRSRRRLESAKADVWRCDPKHSSLNSPLP